MKILVTGAAGFIGSHLCELLVKNKHEVVGIDNFDPFYPRSRKEQNLKHLLSGPNFLFYECDITDREGLNNTLRSESVDVVVHLAAKAGVLPSIQDIPGYINTNINGTQNLLDWMKSKGVKKLVFGSSSSVYGNRGGDAFREDADLSKPISPYAFTKASNELMAFNYHHLFDFDVVNLRFFTVIGPRQRPDLAVHKFFKLIDSGEAITMYGKGDTARDYTFVGDIVDGVYKAIQFVSDNNEVYETINLGNNTPVNLKEMVETIIRVSGKEVEVKQIEEQPGDVKITFADVKKAKKLLGYNPSTTFEEGVIEFRNWFRGLPKQ